MGFVGRMELGCADGVGAGRAPQRVAAYAHLPMYVGYVSGEQLR